MAILKVLADGESSKARDNARGKLFETLMAEVLRQHGYEIGKILNINYGGMEIDIEGTHMLSQTPLYAECKCYESFVNSPKIQAFHGKYMTRWFKNKHCHGLFIAIPGVNSHARAFYKENLKDNNDITTKLFEEDNVLSTIYQSRLVCNPESIVLLVKEELGTAGDNTLLYTDKGYFWIQYVIPKGSGIPSDYMVLDGKGNIINDEETIAYLLKIYPELKSFRVRTFEEYGQTHEEYDETDEIVEVRGSSSCFEYQFPASPEYFVGRDDLIQKIEEFIEKVKNKKTSCRGILFEGYSGWGKSSLVLTCVDRLKKCGHFALAIDSRSAVSAQFPLRLVKHIFSEMEKNIQVLYPKKLLDLKEQ